MKTVKEVADILDVSQVTIYNHLKKNEKELKGQITKKKGITYIKDEGLKVLKVSLGIIQVPEIKETISLENIIDEISNSIIKDTNKKYDDLQEDIKVNNERLEKELKEIKEQNKILMDLLQEKEKKTFIDKVKDLFKST